MKRIFLTALIIVLAGSFLFAGTGRADAMNNESAAVLAGAAVLFGGAVLYTIARDTYRPALAYVDAYPRARYGTRTQIIYERPVYKNWHQKYGRNCRSGRRYDRQERRHY